MTVTAQAGILGYGLQASKGTLAAAWYQAKALSIGMGAVTEKQIAPPEIGGNNNPTGAYKSGSYYAGAFAMLPRLEADIGHLLLGVTGYVNPVPTVNGDSTFTHVFSQAPVLSGGAIYLPWMSYRRYIPGVTATDDLGEIGLDCKVNSAQFTFPQVGPVSMNVNVTGRVPTIDDLATPWTWTNPMEGFESVPVSMTGSFIIPELNAGASMPATGARISLINNTTTVREERILGSYNPDDFATRQRVLQIEWTYKWKDPELYRFIFNNGAANGTFAPCLTSTSFAATITSPCVIDTGVIDAPYNLAIAAPNVDWREAGPIQLAGDEMLMQQYTGIALEAASGDPEDYFTMSLTNARSGAYVLPT